MIVAFSFTQFILHGGFFMYLLVLCSVVSVATMFLRFGALRREAILPSRLWMEVEVMPPNQNVRALARLSRAAKAHPSPLGRVVQVCLRNLKWSRAENMEAVQTRARHEVMGLESGLAILEVIVGVAPLLGLLGAVAGLVTVFGGLGSGEVSLETQSIAFGISEALNTTIAGLAIAVPSLVAHSYFSKKVEVLAADMEGVMSELIAKCYAPSRADSGLDMTAILGGGVQEANRVLNAETSVVPAGAPASAETAQPRAEASVAPATAGQSTETASTGAGEQGGGPHTQVQNH